VAVHGAGRDRRAFLRHTPRLHAAGFSVVLFDCREHGTSSAQRRGIGYATREAEDAALMTKHVRNVLKYRNVIAIGTSQGAAAVIIAAARYGTVRSPAHFTSPLVC
jgi:pimeloyl-ACP methyl ester carboxylesterase